MLLAGGKACRKRSNSTRRLSNLALFQTLPESSFWNSHGYETGQAVLQAPERLDLDFPALLISVVVH